MAPVSVTASTTAEFTGIIGLGPPYQCYGLITNFVFPLPESFAIGPTMTIASFTSNLQVGDQWSRIEIYLRNPA